jgi:hypothetical protein
MIRVDALLPLPFDRIRKRGEGRCCGYGQKEEGAERRPESFIDSSSLASRADERLSLPSCEGVSDRSKGGPYESEEFRLGPEAG